MNGQRLATAAMLVALPVSIAAVPATAAARKSPKHPHHQVARGGHRAHRGGHPARKAHTVTFTARVVRSSASGLVVRTASGRLLSFSKKQIKSGHAPKRHKPAKARGHRLKKAVDLQVTAGNVVVNLLGLQPGVMVQVTETTAPDGTVTITITLPAPSGQEHASGVVTEVDSDAFAVQTSGGVELRLHMSRDALASLGLESCQTVDVTYHQDAGILVADNATATGSSSTGDCAPTYNASGAIAAVSADAVTINTDSGPVSFTVDPSSGLTGGFQVGDVVDVTYVHNADGTSSATDICFVEQETSGQVTAVSTAAGGGSVTMTDDGSGQSETFVADPNNGVEITAHAFNGVSVGDHIDVTYHESGGHLVADTVSDQ